MVDFLLASGLGPRHLQALELLLVAGLGGLLLYRKPRFVADTLSAANLVCGLASIGFAVSARFDLCLVMLLLGACFDGLDGAAARRWGGTRFGVYADDIADGVNYGLAPGVALYFALAAGGRGLEGAVLGAFFALFTLSRLVFFTLEKESSDPNVFGGVPSTVGGLIALSSLLVLGDNVALIGGMVGAACAQMVSFRTHYQHLGRAFAEARRVRIGAVAFLVALVAGTAIFGIQMAAGLILLASLAYGFGPAALALRSAFAVQSRAGESPLESIAPESPRPRPGHRPGLHARGPRVGRTLPRSTGDHAAGSRHG